MMIEAFHDLFSTQVDADGQWALLAPRDPGQPYAKPIHSPAIDLRYRLLPYLYSGEGIHDQWHAVDALCGCIIRSVVAARADEYLWGRDKLVAPVVDPGATSRKVYLPRGCLARFLAGRARESAVRGFSPAGADGSFAPYEDDDASFNYRNGEWMGLAMTWSDSNRVLRLRLAKGSGTLPPLRRSK